MNKKRAKPRFINPPNKLKVKVGSGGISDALIKKGQDAIDIVQAKLEFDPYAQQFLSQINAQIKAAKEVGEDHRGEFQDALAGPVMQLKANGAMFGYDLISEIADIALNFIEEIEILDNEGIEVVQAHERAIQVILQNKLKGNAGNAGYELATELDALCQRYFKKRQSDD